MKPSDRTDWFDIGAQDTDEPRCTCTATVTCPDCYAFAVENGLVPKPSLVESYAQLFRVLAYAGLAACVVAGLGAIGYAIALR